MLHTENLCVYRLGPFNWTFEPGSMTMIQGPNGIGKSTLLNALSGVLKPVSGTVSWSGESLGAMKPSKRVQIISSIAQQDSAPLDTSVKNRIQHGSNCAKAFKRICEELQIEHLLSRQLRQLSVGERKRVHIARSLIQEEAQVYILDEPDSGLDDTSRTLLSQALSRKAKLGKIIVLTSHSNYPNSTRTIDISGSSFPVSACAVHSIKPSLFPSGSQST